jgi:phospholipase/carboxylesterase
MEIKPLSLQHIVQEPGTSEDHPPLLLLLHGVGSNERDLIGLAPYLDDRFFVISARAPITLGPGSYGWYRVTFTEEGPVYQPGAPRNSFKLLADFIDEAVATYSLDPKRIYVMGFSQGGAMTYSLTLTVPDKLAGCVIMSGRTIAEAEEDIAPLERFNNLPVLVVHGTRDTVLPISNGRELKEKLSQLPVDLTYKEYNMAHEVSGETLNEVSAWLKARLDGTVNL